MKHKRLISYLLIALVAFALVGCSSSRNFGQRRAPRNCHTCTRWSN